MKTQAAKLRAEALKRLVNESDPGMRSKLWQTVLANVTLAELREIVAAHDHVVKTYLR